MNKLKLKLAIDAARNDDMERVIKLLEEALAERSNHESELMMNDGNYRRKILAELDIEEMTLTQIAARHEQAEQEPVAYLRMGSDQRFVVTKAAEELVADKFHELYAAPVRTKDLTDDEIAMCMGKDLWNVYKNEVDFARAVIAADREKNK